MAAGLAPQSVKKIRSALGTANANRDGTGTLVTILTGIAGQMEAIQVSMTFIVATTEGMIRFYSDDNTNKTLIGEVHVPAWTPSAIRPTLQLKWDVPEANKYLYATTETLKASIERAEACQLETSYKLYA